MNTFSGSFDIFIIKQILLSLTTRAIISTKPLKIVSIHLQLTQMVLFTVQTNIAETYYSAKEGGN